MAAHPGKKEIRIILFLTLNLLFLALNGRAEERKMPPQGMDLLQVGATQVLVPAGTKIVRKDGLIILENIAEYVSRQVVYMNKEIDELKEENKSLKEEIKTIRQALLELKEKAQELPVKGSND
jgi:FtsZ-binding cell division protein ZapB